MSGSFFEAANINAGGNVKANYIMNSTINTMGRVIVSGSKGVLLGGTISAVKGVDTFNLGNRLHIKTILDIGRNGVYAKEQEEYEEESADHIYTGAGSGKDEDKAYAISYSGAVRQAS